MFKLFSPELTTICFDAADLYRFDLQGYLYLPGAIVASQIKKLNQEVDRIINGMLAPTYRLDYALDKKPVFRALLDAIDCGPLFGNLPYRLDHDFLQVIRKGRISRGLHGGGCPYDPAQSYTVRNGKIYCGLVAVSIALTDAPIELGGLGVIPGSHHSNFPPHDSDSLVQGLDVKAGDAIVFTEALRHCSLDWTGNTDRRTVFLKFSPAHSAYSSHRYAFEHDLARHPSVWH